MIYSGVGARKTPPDVLEYFERLAAWLAGQGFTLRSGGADGADTAFFKGCASAGGQREIFTAQDAASRPDWFECAARYHPAWEKCGSYARALHARNSPIVVGRDLSSPSDFVTCWTECGQVTGGTGQSLRIASANSIPIFNFGMSGAEQALKAFLASKGVAV